MFWLYVSLSKTFYSMFWHCVLMIWSGLGTTTIKLIVSCCHKNDWRRPDFSSEISVFWWDVLTFVATNILTSHQKCLFFCWDKQCRRCPDLSPKNICFCRHKHGWRCPDFSSKISVLHCNKTWLKTSRLLIRDICFLTRSQDISSVLQQTHPDFSSKIYFCGHERERDVLTPNQKYRYYIAVKHDWRCPDFSSVYLFFFCWKLLTRGLD